MKQTEGKQIRNTACYISLRLVQKIHSEPVHTDNSRQIYHASVLSWACCNVITGYCHKVGVRKWDMDPNKSYA